ncbi:glycosyltransferase [Xenorhabdus budapestensis]|uniref:Glycosyltransferase n=1 Tax=Xenorhabdus budapestensis TaxID=290110 RepID=A0A2D0IWA5_XENBU|nr:glycosyltransferase [Xenorhabdus budapestensis]PHM26199.1 putative glycosyltransferase [Xenorhabdus budapestensis]QTL39820.1 glycosyltransferase [Xenorhabdus budapestensis]
MKGHILFIIDGLPGGGAENVVVRLCRGLQQKGFDITLLSLSDKCEYSIPEHVDLVIDADKYAGPFRRQTEIFRRAKSMDKVLEKILRQKGIPALVISNLHKTDRIVAKSKVLENLNVWFCIHGVFSKSYLENKTGLARWLKKHKIQRVYQDRNLICVSDAVGLDLQENLAITARRMVTIYNPFDITEIKLNSLENNPYSGQDYILHLGRFHEVKRHDRLLEAFAMAVIPCNLLIAGHGDEKMTDKIKQKIVELGLQSRVKLIGFLTNPLPVIREAKAVVLSSDSEGLGNVLIEALICQTPVVSTNCPGGIGEIMMGELEQYKSELTSESLAEKMRLVYQNPPLITENMYKKFDLDVVVSEYLSLIEQQ